MHSLLLVAHGSRRAASNDEVRVLTQALSARAGGRFDTVTCAFLELADPSIPEGLEACIRQGAQRVVVLPYFLAAGRHVVEDIPALVEPVRQRHPGVAIQIASHLGAAEGLAGLLLSLAPD